ncbi:hypothetical protein [Methylobacterium sp. WL120]|uniref:hypothetical protein n=1 Tax=Methylobacterium sp. WL120 TaxID=2603887 RepID=UPI001FEE8DB3|nr:hypothetical protein [Methylobacterium sp. WL120]
MNSTSDKVPNPVTTSPGRPSHPAGSAGRAGAVRRLLGALALCAAAATGACSSDLSPIKTLAVEAGYGPKPVAAPDFVANSRSKADPEFMPVGVSAPARPVRAKSAESQKALEAELEGARGRNESKGRAAESAGKATKPASALAQPAQ